jgi:hypothetical protein
MKSSHLEFDILTAVGLQNWVNWYIIEYGLMFDFRGMQHGNLYAEPPIQHGRVGATSNDGKKTTRKGVSRAGSAGEGAESSDILRHCGILIEKPALRE